MTLNDDEKVIVYVRRHWILFVVRIVPIVFLAIIPAIFPAVIDVFLPKNLERFQNAGWALYCMWVTLLWVWSFLLWTEYYLDVWVITNRKIINADQITLFNRKMSTLELEKIQDITIEIDGFIQTMFGYGTIRVQTAGEITKFTLQNAAHPDIAKEKIIQAQRRIAEERMSVQSRIWN